MARDKAGQDLFVAILGETFGLFLVRKKNDLFF
jgi:hypothetical protein